MTNLKYQSAMCGTLVSLLLLSSCNLTDPAPENNIETVTIYKSNGYSTPFIISDTVVNKKVTTLHDAPTAVDLGDLKNIKRYVAIGSSITAGVRDWGLYRDAQLTSFPNLLAIQLKLASFKQPLFGENEYNGFGYKTLSGFPKYNAVKNNLAIESITNGIKLKAFEGEMDNLGIPYFPVTGVSGDAIKDKTSTLYKDSAPFYYRINNDKFILNKLPQNKVDFFTYELGFYELLRSSLNGGYEPENYGWAMDITFSAFMPIYFQRLQDLKTGGSFGCLSTIPNVWEFPFFQKITLQEIKKVTNSKDIFVNDPSGIDPDIVPVNLYSLIVPNSRIDSLLNSNIKGDKKGLTAQNPLNDKDIITTYEIEGFKKVTNNNNSFIIKWAKDNNYPVADLNALFKKIVSGSYTTEDGIKVDATFPKGNFFSSDGIHPSAFGQAIIANEFIKALNLNYKANIPLIKTSLYLAK